MNPSPYPFLQGWLEKRKRKQTGFLPNTTKRWFTIEKFGPDQEVALCYYQNPSSPSISGWIFLSDVKYFYEKNEDGRTWIVIKHPSRTFWLGSFDTHQHHLWINNLSHYCKKESYTNSFDSSPARQVQTRISKTLLEPADPRGDFGYPSSRRSSLQSTSERDFSSELEFIKSITGAKGYQIKDDTATNSPMSTFIQHDYDLGLHLRTSSAHGIGACDDIVDSIDDKASIENAPTEPGESQEVNSSIDEQNTVDKSMNEPEHEVRNRLCRGYNFVGETMNSRLNRAILIDENSMKDVVNYVEDGSLATEQKPSSPNLSNEVTGERHSYIRNEVKTTDSDDAPPLDKKMRLNLDDECSFAPDDDFLTADWDEESE